MKEVGAYYLFKSIILDGSRDEKGCKWRWQECQ